MDNDTSTDIDHRAKSLQTLAENQRWLEQHREQTVHPGDLPVAEMRKDSDNAGEQPQ